MNRSRSGDWNRSLRRLSGPLNDNKALDAGLALVSNIQINYVSFLLGSCHATAMLVSFSMIRTPAEVQLPFRVQQ